MNASLTFTKDSAKAFQNFEKSKGKFGICINGRINLGKQEYSNYGKQKEKV